MPHFIEVSNIVEPNGKTVKENNLDLQHPIPIGALVEIVGYDDDDDVDNLNGIRLFVVNHSRDCDGTPLYDLGYDKQVHQEWSDLDRKVRLCDYDGPMDEALTKAVLWQANGKILRHFSADSLKLIRN